MDDCDWEKGPYVLIYCGEQNENGNLSVTMHYEGDVGIISYLLHSAQEHLLAI